MTSFLLWATLGLVTFVPTIDGSRSGGCPQCACCGCCDTGTCTCCVAECPTAGAKAEREACCGSGCCGK